MISKATITCGALIAGLGLIASPAKAQNDVVGGQTNVLLDTSLLSTAAGLDLSSISSNVIAPGELGSASVAFGINPRTASSLPTTFSYANGLSSFSGTIEHSGSVFFNSDTVEVGNFTIGYDAARVGGDRSGFFVESTTGVAAILFDVGSPAVPQADSTGLQINSDLLVSTEFANFLGDSALTGADVGDAFLNASSVPEPTSLALLALGGMAMLRRRR